LNRILRNLTYAVIDLGTLHLRAAHEPPAAPKELPAKPSSEPPVAPPAFEDGLIATIARIELEISALDKQREALKIAVEILRQRSGATPE